MTEREGAAAAVGVALLAVALTIGMMHGRTHSDLLFYACALAQSGLSVAAGRLAAGPERRSALVILVGAAILLRLAFVAEAPMLSGDVYRYIWDGRVVNAGLNPYAHVPADPALAALRDPAQYGLIDKRDYAVTLYPPVAEGLFALVTRASTSVWAMKLAMVAAECLAVLAVARLLRELGRPIGLVVAYLLHPAPLWEIAGNGHADAVAMACLYAAFAWGGGALRPYRSALIMTLGALVKPEAALGLPGLWRPFQIALPLFVISVILFCYLPFLGASAPAGVFGFLPGYVHEQGLDSGQGFYWLALLDRLGVMRPPTAAYVALAAALMLALALTSRWRRSIDPRSSLAAAALMLIAGLLLLTPVFPWYFLIALPMTVLLGWRSPVALASCGFLLYSFNLDAPPFFVRWSVVNAVAVVAATRDVAAWRAGGRER